MHEQPKKAIHQFAQSQAVEAKHAPRLDAWLSESYPIREATMAEQWQGIDRVAITFDGYVTIDYKCDEKARKTDRLFLETVSNSVTGRPGWMRTSRADWLVYFVVPETVWMFRFDRLRRMMPGWQRTYGERAARNVSYATLGVCVPVTVAVSAVEYLARLAHGDGAVLEVSDRWRGTRG